MHEVRVTRWTWCVHEIRITRWTRTALGIRVTRAATEAALRTWATWSVWIAWRVGITRWTWPMHKIWIARWARAARGVHAIAIDFRRIGVKTYVGVIHGPGETLARIAATAIVALGADLWLWAADAVAKIFAVGVGKTHVVTFSGAKRAANKAWTFARRRITHTIADIDSCFPRDAWLASRVVGAITTRCKA